VISQFNAIQVTKQASQVVPTSLQLILDKYPKVFEIPIALHPSRGENDDNIPLLPGSQLPNVHPYRYPFSPKNEIEKMVHELLETGVIHLSTNPYSSPMVMVLKKEGTDACALNKITIKDKFPIHVIDDLLDEIQGAHVFTKLDLHSGYHQICMKETYIPNTAIRTHKGNYEFLVMPFGLCNTPSTFQSLMNKLMKHYIHKFVLVFFDDILIYKRTWDSHLLHVDKVLHLLQENQLFVKKTKCSFGANEIEYFGHIVSRKGVKVDPKKIEAM
jgi:hypothetical protein